MEYIVDIGLEVHAELATRSKMFCSCPVVDSTHSEPNAAVCPVCMGMPGVLPVLNQQAVEYGLRVALALNCIVHHTSLFARKNYFYPDLPKGYQISQYEYPLAVKGILPIRTVQGEKTIRIHRVHLEEDTGKLTHVFKENEEYSLVDLNRAGVPLLEIVSEPDLHSVEDVRAYAAGLRQLLRYLAVNSGDMEKGVIRFEANVSLRPSTSAELGTRVEIKNLNSFRALERSIHYQVAIQTEKLDRGEAVAQETLGWDAVNEITFSQRSKEEAHDYRYFPEPDLPPLVVETEHLEVLQKNLPELPYHRIGRFMTQYSLPLEDARMLVEDSRTADFYEAVVSAATPITPRNVANWLAGEVFAHLNQSGQSIDQLAVSPAALADLLRILERGEINLPTAKMVLAEMLVNGGRASEIISARGLKQVSDEGVIAEMVQQVIGSNPEALASYQAGKETLANWFFGQVMRTAASRANPQVVKAELQRQLDALKK